MFFAFVFYQTHKSTDFDVLKIKSPTQIVVDLNKNGVEDNNETIVLKGIKSFSTKQGAAQSKLALRLKISPVDAIGLGWLAQNFAKETLLDKKVQIKIKSAPVIPHLMRDLSDTPSKSDYQIIVNGKNYEDLLVNQGLAVRENQASTPQLKKNIEKVKKLHLVILNNKNHKYHLLNCKYGQMAHNSQIIPIMQLSKDAKPCKFCLAGKQKTKSKKQKVKWLKTYNDYDPNYHLIANITPPAQIYQTDPIKVFLTDMTRTIKPSNTCNTDVCRALASEIDSACNSIDFAIYGYTKIPAIENALKKAQNRGVKIRFVYDTDSNGNNIYPNTNYLTTVFTNNNTDRLAPIMHDKFFIFDGKKVLTGSANISNTDMSGYNSNAIIIMDSPEAARIYSQEFEQMYAGRWHKAKHKFGHENVQIGNSEIEIYFSPEDKPLTQHVIPLIDNAKKYIYIPAFLITHKNMAQSLIAAEQRGVDVKIILDATNTHDSATKLKMLRLGGIPVKTEIFAGKLHSKSIIIDDAYTIIGSMNFSRSGEGANDENLVIIKNLDIAVFYKRFFLYLWKRIPDKWLKLNARSESPDSVGSCSDGIDNDFDGKIDMADDSCKPYKIIKIKELSSRHEIKRFK